MLFSRSIGVQFVRDQVTCLQVGLQVSVLEPRVLLEEAVVLPGLD